jgi:hypothetical protein
MQVGIRTKKPGIKKVRVTIEIFGIPNPPKPEIQLVPLPRGRKDIDRLVGPQINNQVKYGLKKFDKFEVVTEMPDTPGKGRKITYELIDE